MPSLRLCFLACCLLTAVAYAQNLQIKLGPSPSKVDRRIPYYILPGCEYMLDAFARCDAKGMPAPGGCCPIGFNCSPKGAGQGSICQEAVAAYELSVGCSKRVGAHKECSNTTCCPDGFDCLLRASTNKSTCEWSGRALVVPKSSSYSAKIKPTTAGRKLHSADDATSFITEATDSHHYHGRKLHQLINYCANTTLPPGCSKMGRRAQGPSGKCYDIPLFWNGTPPALDISNTGQWIIRATNTPAKIRGINWFGFNVGQSMVDGLWADGYQTATISDYPTILKRIKLLGFNGLRLPFTFSELDAAPRAQLYGYGTCRVESTAQFKASLTPDYTTPTNSYPESVYLSTTSCPYTTNPTASTAGSLKNANMHVPGKQDSTAWNRFFWVIQYAVGQGFYVVPEFHFEQSGLQNNAAQFAAEWRRFWKDFVRLPTYAQYLSGRVFPELANEWDKFGCKWDTTSAGCTSTYADAMSKAATAIKEESQFVSQPVPIILIEGVGQQGYGFSWGDGFITDTSVINPSWGISNARPFFAADDASKTFRLSLAPHAYGPSVTGETVLSKTYGATLWDRLTRSWGSKTSCSSCTTSAAGINQFYPISPTEWGSDCDTYSSPGCSDYNFLRDFALYLNNAGSAASYGHTPANVWFWWCWNANSGDTGGIVSGASPGFWYNVKWYKIRYLQTVGLCPWYASCYGA